MAAEALRNLCRHSHGTQIEAELSYDSCEFRLRSRDDGQGIDPQILAGGGGHDTSACANAAKLAGSKLTLRVAPDSGAEVELLIARSAAYGANRSATE